uniref:Uncharacterized protein n=1 Tax=Arundo donax TaxID=35708 RepID=A0A0A9EX22_ARUDO
MKLRVLCLHIFQFDGDLLSSLHINSKEELPERSAPDLLAELELTPDHMIHLVPTQIEMPNPTRSEHAELVRHQAEPNRIGFWGSWDSARPDPDKAARNPGGA